MATLSELLQERDALNATLAQQPQEGSNLSNRLLKERQEKAKERLVSLNEEINTLQSTTPEGTEETQQDTTTPSTAPEDISTTTTGSEGTGVTLSPERATAVTSQVLTNIAEPQVPESAVQTAQDIQVGAEEIVDPTDPRFQMGEQAAVTAAQGTAVTQSAPEDITAPQVEAAQAEAATAQAAVSELPEEFLTSGQLTKLLQTDNPEEIPDFAKPAVAAVDRMLAARGISRSSIGAEQLTNTLIQAALPIAQADAQALQQNFAQNLSNEQQTSLANAQLRQQTLLSNQSATNAAAQFNATSQMQTDQFMTNLRATVDRYNADRVTAMSQFNTGQTNAMSQFNSQLSAARDQFNAQNSTAIEQSNVQWRRQANQVNTAAQNAVNQANAMNAFNLSNQALTLMWQELRDAAKWTFEAAQNDKQRAAALAQAAMGNEAAKDAKYVDNLSAIGGAILNIWSQ